MAAPCCVDCYSFVYFEVRGPDASNSFILLNVGVFFPYYIINFKLFFYFGGNMIILVGIFIESVDYLGRYVHSNNMSLWA